MPNNPLYGLHKDYQLHLLDKRENGLVIRFFIRLEFFLDPPNKLDYSDFNTSVISEKHFKGIEIKGIH